MKDAAGAWLGGGSTGPVTVTWRVVLAGADAPVSVHDTEEEARERLAAYVRGAAAAAAPTAITGIARGDRALLPTGAEVIVRTVRRFR